MRLEPAPDADRAWLRATLDRISDGVRITLASDGTLALAHPTTTAGLP
jgi:poly-gamma-glutamate synthesis protein (capsule biosynthesis protein)